MTDADTDAGGDVDVLVTGYEPFGEFERNPARTLATRLDGETVAGASVVGRELPVAFDRMEAELGDILAEFDPDVVCGLGLAAGRNTLSLERVGINLRDTSRSETPDNDGREVVDEPVTAEGPNAYFTTLPVREMKSAMCAAGVPTTLSTDAGTHLCNDFLYAARHLAEMEDGSTTTEGSDHRFRAGFVHVPFSHEQAAARDEGESSMALEAMLTGLREGLAVSVDDLHGEQ